MSWIEWGVLALGLALGYFVVSMLMGERKARGRREEARQDGPAGDGGQDRQGTAARDGDGGPR